MTIPIHPELIEEARRRLAAGIPTPGSGISPELVSRAAATFEPPAPMMSAAPSMAPPPQASYGPPPPPPQAPHGPPPPPGPRGDVIAGPITAGPSAPSRAPAMAGGAPGGTPGGALSTARHAIDDSYRDERQAIADQARAEQAKASFVADESTRHYDQYRADLEREHAENARASAEHANYLRATDGVLDDVRTQKINPDEFFESDGSRAMAVVAVLLGGIGAGLTGGENGALKIINASIDRNIRAQEANLANKRSAAQAKLSIYGQMRDAFRDRDTANATYRAAANQAWQQKIASEAERLGNPTVKARATEAIAQLQRQQEREKLAAAQAAAGAVAAQAARAREEARKERDEGRKDRELDIKAAEVGVKGREADAKGDQAYAPALLIDNGDGTSTVARDEKGADKVRNRKAFENQIARLQDEAADIFREHGRMALIPGTAAHARLEKIREQAIPVQSLAMEQGVVREYERDPTLKALGLGGYGALSTGGGPLEHLAMARKTLHTGSEELIRQHGGPVVREQWVRQPDGTVKRRVELVRDRPDIGSGASVVRPLSGAR